MVEPIKLPDDAHLTETRKLLEEMDSLLRRVRILMLDHPTPKLVEESDEGDKK